MNASDRRRLLVILGVLIVFLIPIPLHMTRHEAAIPLGLDLSGGVDVQIGVDMDYTARQVLNNLKFDVNSALRSSNIPARLEMTPETEELGLRLILRSPSTDASAAAQEINRFVTSGEIMPFDEQALADSRGVTLHLSQKYLNQRADQAIANSAKIVKERVDALGVAQSDVRVEGQSHIRIQLPGQRDPNRVINNLIRPATLELHLVHPEMDRLLPQLINPDGTLRPGMAVPPEYEILPGEADDNPQFRQTQYPPTGNTVYYLVRRDYVIGGENLRTVRAVPGGQFGTEMVVVFELDPTGTRLFRQATEENIGERLAIVLEGRVRSAPNIRSAIPNGRGEISGNFTLEEAKDLENVLRTGALPTRLVPGQVSVVGASLGADSIRAGLRASAIGAAFVFLFMIWYYAVAGWIAAITLLINVLLILGVLSWIRATLTLPGIAGIILTLGMAVDANVLIYERVREELRSGKSLRNAIGLGFNRAFSAIFDANITTLITSLVLLQFGFGPIRGFALTMTFGIFATLFTGLFVTQTFLFIVFDLRERLPLGKVQFFQDPHFDWIGFRWWAYAISFTLVAAAVGDLVINKGPRLGVDFTGGLQTEVAANTVLGRQQVETALSRGGFASARVQTIERAGVREEVPAAETPETPAASTAEEASAPGGAAETGPRGVITSEADYLIRIPESEMLPASGEISSLTRSEQNVVGAVQRAFPEAHIWATQTRGVSAETGAVLRATALGIAIVAFLGIFIYVAVRFDRVYSIAALVALVHDVMIAWGVGSMLNVDLSLDVVAALLTIMGYSINDTIVIFDRIRENFHAMEGRAFRDVINISLNQTLSRTVITSGVTLLTVISLLVLGGPGVRDFSLTLFIGFVVGCYSSAFIAAPMVWGWVTHRHVAPALAKAKA
jgi:SecD/SecF fusion protein